MDTNRQGQASQVPRGRPGHADPTRMHARMHALTSRLSMTASLPAHTRPQSCLATILGTVRRACTADDERNQKAPQSGTMQPRQPRSVTWHAVLGRMAEMTPLPNHRCCRKPRTAATAAAATAAECCWAFAAGRYAMLRLSAPEML